MELWQMDVMGGVRLEDGREPKIVSGIDDHSRYCVSALLTARATAQRELDRWVARYNHERPHQGIGMVPPARALNVRLIGDLVQISLAGRVLRTRAAHHAPEKLHGAFAIAKGRPRRHESAPKGGLSSIAAAE